MRALAGSERVEERENPDADIGFVVCYPFHYYIYKNIYKQFSERAEFIVDLGAFPSRQPPELIFEITELLQREAVSYKILYYEDYSFSRYIERFFRKYHVLVAVWERGCVTHKATSGIRKIGVAYGAAKELTHVRPSQGVYDLTLAYGPHGAQLLGNLTNTVIVGNAKFDDWFDGSLTEDRIALVRSGLNPRKKTVLYLPTHSDLSSIDHLTEPLTRLTQYYNVLIKLHYYTRREEPNRLAALVSTGAKIFEDSEDLLPLLKVADAVLSDNSGAIFDAILADKPVLVADLWPETTLDTEHKEVRRYRRGAQGALTYSRSIEQRIKREGRVLTVNYPHQLREKIEEALQDAEFFKHERVKIRDELFSFNDGKCAERAATAIVESIEDDSLKNRPIMYHAFEAYKRRFKGLSYERERELNKTIREYQDLVDRKTFEQIGAKGVLYTTIIIGDAKGDLQTLRSLIEQRFPPENHEVVTLDDSDEILAGKIASIPVLGNKAPYASAVQGGSLGDKIERALARAQGEIICFTTTDCIVPDDWLQGFHHAYERHSDVAGIGGYKKVPSTLWNPFQEILYFGLGKSVGIEKESKFLSKLYEMKNSLVYGNPSGDLSNMSYKKECLPRNLRHLNDIRALALHLKLSTLKQRPLCFIPKAVTSQRAVDFREFFRTHWAEGFLNRVARRTIREISKYRGQSFISAFTDAFRTAFVYRSLRYGAIAFVGNIARWVGRISALAVLVRRGYL